MKPILIVSLLLFANLALHGQERSKVKTSSQAAGSDPGKGTRLRGRTVDSAGKHVPFVSLALFRDDILLTGSMSDEAGVYQLAYPFAVNQKYRLTASSLGYRPLSFVFTYPDTTLTGSLTLTEEQNMLKTVSVRSQRPLIERRTDRYVVNVEGSLLESGNNGLEVLQKSPGVWVGSDGSIKIKGNQSVAVMINDVVQRMSESDLAEYLRTLKSEDISRIEIISSPPSEFEAAGSGGIIHIVLKKSRKDGMVGTLFGQYRQQEERPAYTAGSALNYKIKNLYLSGTISAGKDESDYVAITGIEYPDKDQYSSLTRRYNNNGRLMYRAGASYDLGARQSLGAQFMHNASRLDQYFDTDIVLRGAEAMTGIARSEWFRRPSFNSLTLNYSLQMDSLGSGLKIIGDYLNSTKTELNNFQSSYSLSQRNSHFRNNTPNVTDLYSIQSDLTQVLNKTTSLKAGIKIVGTKRDNEVINENYAEGKWQLNDRLSNQFVYKELLSMAYTSMEKRLGKLDVKVGLRAEFTKMDGNTVTTGEQFDRNYFSVFPSVFVVRRLNERKASSVYMSYSKRIQRPSFADLNPYRLQFDDYLTQLGNPDLMPEYTHKLELGSVFWKSFSADVYYSSTSDKIAQLARPMQDKVIEYQTMNFNSSKEYGLSLNAPVSLVRWWKTNTSIALYNLRYALNEYNIRQTTFYARTQHEFSIKNLGDVDLSVDYRSPYVNANTYVAYQFATDAGISRRFLDRSMLLRFNVADILNTAREKNYTLYEGTRIDFYQKRPTRTFSISLSYNFSSGKKFSNKQIEQSVNEEKNRIGN
ncbi:MAG: outer membrane beta-barrel protein [Arcticibacter sp.]